MIFLNIIMIPFIYVFDRNAYVGYCSVLRKGGCGISAPNICVSFNVGIPSTDV